MYLRWEGGGEAYYTPREDLYDDWDNRAWMTSATELFVKTLAEL